jgi:hypothetical protein
MYIRIGIGIFCKRSTLRAFGSGGQTHTSLTSRSSSQIGSRYHSSPVKMVSFSQPAFMGMRTTEVEVTFIQNNLAVPAPTHT